MVRTQRPSNKTWNDYSTLSLVGIIVVYVYIMSSFDANSRETWVVAGVTAECF